MRTGYLIKKKQHCCSMWECTKKFGCSSKLKAIVWILVLYGTVNLSSNLLYSTARLSVTSQTQVLFYVMVPGAYLFFPILAYLGERFSRYRIMIGGVIVTILSSMLFILLLIVQAATGASNFLNYSLIVVLISAVCGKGLYITNLPQFGASQLQFASSAHLAAFARWGIWTFLLSLLVSAITDSVLVKYTEINLMIIVNGMYFLMLLSSFMMVYRLRHTLIIDPPPEIDGLKLIWRVMRYSWKHKYPVRRSAFTYSEDLPTRMDLAKDRYGGPFTTKQVEEVKSFWYLILIPVCHFFNIGLYSSLVLTYQYTTNCQETLEIEQSSIFEKMFLVNSTSLSKAVAVIGLLVFQLVIVPFFPKLIPSILQRIWIGLFFFLLSLLSVMIMSFNVTSNLPSFSELSGSSSITTCDELWPFYLFIIPELFAGLGEIFNPTSQLEFIFAQAPYNMQSIFIGALYTQYIFPYLCSAVGLMTPAGRYWQFYVILCCLQLVVIVAFTIVKRQYKYRQCNNDSDLNIRVNIEDVYERDLDARDLALKRSYQSMNVTYSI